MFVVVVGSGGAAAAADSKDMVASFALEAAFVVVNRNFHSSCNNVEGMYWSKMIAVAVACCLHDRVDIAQGRAGNSWWWNISGDNNSSKDKVNKWMEEYSD